MVARMHEDELVGAAILKGPLADLRDEHRLIERVIAVLEAVSARLSRGQEAPAVTLGMAVDFLRGFTDGCHHRKEERVLFPVLAAKSPILEQGPTRILSGEHEAGRRFTAEINDAFLAGGGSEGERARAKRAIDLYTRMLRRHIAKEEEIVFRVADYLISDREAGTLQKEMDAIEADMGPDAHNRYAAMVEAMERSLE